jgi:hypothetical protein
MDHIVEVDETGGIQLPANVLVGVKPRTQYVLLQRGTTLVLQPRAVSLWARTSPAERAAALRAWAAQERPHAPVLPNEALRREQMYD